MPSGHPPSPNSIIVGNCIACNGLVRMSATAKANAKVRCPHCKEIFPLISLLESAAPEVEVLHSDATAPLKKKELYIDQTATTAKDASGKFVVPSQLAKGARRRKSSRSRSESSRSRSSSSRSESERSSRSDRQPTSRSAISPSARRGQSTPRERVHKPETAAARKRRPAATGTTYATPPRDEPIDHSRERTDSPTSGDQSHRSTRHRDARAVEALNSERNPAVDLLKVLAGACLALPVAYLIVMWIFTLDPLGIGKGLGERAPFMVPTAFRPKADVDVVEVETASSIGTSFLGDSEDAKANAYGFDNLNIGTESLKRGDAQLVK